MPGARIPWSFLHELVRGKLSQHLTSFILYLDLCRNENCTRLAPLVHIVVVSGPAFFISFSCKAMKSTILYIDTDLNFMSLGAWLSGDISRCPALWDLLIY